MNRNCTMESVAVAREAMATRFEILLYGTDTVALRAAAEEALDEIERLDAQLSLYRPASEISQINAQASNRPVRVEPGLFRLLQHAQLLHQETQGAFDITIAPLMRCWGFMGGSGRLPKTKDLAAVREKVGMQWVTLDEEDFTVRFARSGMMLDLGAIGKGYAVERAAQILREAGVRSAFLHGGTSSIYALGNPPDAEAWKVAVERPGKAAAQNQVGRLATEHCAGDWSYLSIIPLKDESLSVSAVWGKSFQAGGRVYGHVIDPRLGTPVKGALLAVVVLPSATETDALSTALLTLGTAGQDAIAHLRPGMRTLVATQKEGSEVLHIKSQGLAIAPFEPTCDPKGAKRAKRINSERQPHPASRSERSKSA
jgi:thiamine biosynthesis lipoprotein